MDINNFIKLFLKRYKLIIVLPLFAGILTFLATGNMGTRFVAKATLFTGITASGSLNDIGGENVDFYATRAAYNNLISILNSRKVIEETSLRLLAWHLTLDSPSVLDISEVTFHDLHKMVPDDLKKIIDKQDVEKTYQILNDYLQQDKKNFIYGLINYDHPVYSYKALSSIKTLQINSSDLIEISYQANDPAIAYQTLNILIEVFIRNYSEVKRRQTDAVVSYFNSQLAQSSELLQNVEDSLLIFNKANNIINYYEQTKYISSQQEKIDVRLQDIILEYDASAAVLQKIEAEIKSRSGINLYTGSIMEIREDLVNINSKIAASEIVEMETGIAVNEKVTLFEARENLEALLESRLDSLAAFHYGSDGIAIELLLNKWLTTVTEFESSAAKLKTMQTKGEEYSKLYIHYAPLGAFLKRIEREISVREQAYLQILHNLGLAKLKQQSEEMRADMKIIDKPQLPINAEPTKRKLYTIIISMFALIFTVSGIFIYEMFDKTIKSVPRLTRLTRLQVAGAIPEKEIIVKPNPELIIKSGLKNVIQEIISLRNNSDSNVTVQFVSIEKGEGKTFLTDVVSAYLQKLRYNPKKIRVVPGSVKGEQSDNDYHTITTDESFSYSSYDEIMKTFKEMPDMTDISLVEIPALSENILNEGLVGTASLTYLIFDATREWTLSDSFICETFRKVIPGSLEGILNRASEDNLEPFVNRGNNIGNLSYWLKKHFKGIRK